jgi:hypothetical protein
MFAALFIACQLPMPVGDRPDGLLIHLDDLHRFPPEAIAQQNYDWLCDHYRWANRCSEWFVSEPHWQRYAADVAYARDCWDDLCKAHQWGREPANEGWALMHLGGLANVLGDEDYERGKMPATPLWH